MKLFKFYFFEYVLIFAVMLISIAGFWNIFFGADAKPTRYHVLHITTVFCWLILLLIQLSLIGRKKYLNHKTVGLLVLFFGPLLFASTALLAVHSAYKGLISGKGDDLFTQNVMGTLELGFLILMAFVVRKRRALHGAFMLGTTLLFMGIALFFALLAWVPMFKIEGPETFYRFGTAALTGLVISLLVGIFFFAKDRRNGWPILLAGSFLLLNAVINSMLGNYNLIQPLTELVGSFSELLTFLAAFVVLLGLLILTGITKRDSPKVEPS